MLIRRRIYSTVGTKRVKDLIAAFVVGNGVLDLIAPQQRTLLWAFGPEGLRNWLAEHPQARRLQGALRVGVGLWLALTHYQQQTPRRPWHERYRFSEYRFLAGWLSPLSLLVILLTTALAVTGAVIYRRRSRGEGPAVEEQAREEMRRLIRDSIERSRQQR
jgi:hypothetical protein